MKKTDKQIEKLEKLAADIERLPLTKKLREEEAAETARIRRDAESKMKAGLAELEKHVVSSKGELAAIEQSILDAEKHVKSLRDSFTQVKVSAMNREAALSAAVRSAEAVLLSNYSPAIDEAILFFQKKIEDLRRPGVISSQNIGGERNIFSETIKTRVESNYESVLHCLEFCKNAIAILEANKLDAACDTTGIDVLKSAMPKIEYAEIDGERPMPGSKGVNPRDLLHSDGALDFLKNRVLKKAEELLKR